MAHHPFPWRDAFLQALREVPVVARACEAVGIERSTAYRAREADKDFAQAWDDAMEHGVDRAEAEAFRRAVTGFEEPVVYQGQLTPVWARDERGMVLTREVPTETLYPKGHPQEGQPVMSRVPVQAVDEQGRPVWLTVRKHSDTLLALILKGRRKSLYADRQELTGADGGALMVDESLRSARVAQLMAVAKARRAAGDMEPEDFA